MNIQIIYIITFYIQYESLNEKIQQILIPIHITMEIHHQI